MIADADSVMPRTGRGVVALSLSVLITLCWLSLGYGTDKTPAPEITGQTWLNSAPIRIEDKKGKVVLVKFWTFGCYNCRNVEPYVKSWHTKYTDQGLVVIGVHTPESEMERLGTSVERYVREQQIPYAVVTDNDFATWTRYGNLAWPTVYLIDKHGFLRYTHIGEGRYTQTEQQIVALLAEQ